VASSEPHVVGGIRGGRVSKKEGSWRGVGAGAG
jgi:hypothetical protein